MSRQIQLRRGSASEHNNFTGAVGEVTVDTTTKTLRVHDGITPGGTALAKSDASNFTAAGKNTVSKFCTPSNRYTDLTLAESNTNYLAPANGWFVLNKQNSIVGQSLRLSNTANQIRSYARLDSGGIDTLSVNVPVQAGQYVNVFYTTTGNTIHFRFVYAEGAE